MPLLEIRDLQKVYREPDGSELPILDVGSFDMDGGEQVVLRGRSGCGKTTLLHSVAGLTTVTSGSIRIAGVDITNLAEAGRDKFRAQNIGYVFQTFNLLQGFTALENVLLGMAFTRQRANRERAVDLLERVGLAHRMSHKPTALSVGEQQRVAVARALANKPLLLLADEPTANVDPGHQQQVIDLLREVCQAETVAMLLVTHANDVADQFERVEYLEEMNRVVAA